jgi:uncharacterized protein YbjT (DUF2867 family)
MSLNGQSPVLVIGATGNVGRNVVAQLAEKGVKVRAGSRNPKAASVSGAAEVVHVDLDDPATLRAAAEGVDRVFLMVRGFSVRPEGIREALKGQVGRVVFLSSMAVEDDTPVQTNPIGKAHAEIEGAIAETGAEWTFLRAGAFATNTLGWWGPQIKAGNVVRWPYGEAQWASIHEADLAAVAVCALTEDGHAGKKYVLTGGEVLTQREQLHTIGEAIGRSLRYEELDPKAAKVQMKAYLPEFVVDRLLPMWASAVGRPAVVTQTVQEVTGAPARTFWQWAMDHANEF